MLTNYELVKRTVSMSAAISGVVGSNYPPLLFPAIYYINSYVFLDLFFAKTDMIIHHLLVLSFFAAMNIHEYSDEYKLNFTNQVIKFEYSTIVYSGGPLVLHFLSQKKGRVAEWMPVIRNGFHIAFAILFLKYRIVDFSTNIVFNENTYYMTNFQTNVAFVHLIGTTWAFNALNLYWLQLILRKLLSTKK